MHCNFPPADMAEYKALSSCRGLAEVCVLPSRSWTSKARRRRTTASIHSTSMH
ncbi:UNVERIFIED_CONTAM: hypothetical protein PYX00_002756 [Menopon gallinae]|uniref:Uncharacterized protein n=1 Tax=Menopon gallinae TaxID=328185 RepID=A0AAW2HZ17_9NEOP